MPDALAVCQAHQGLPVGFLLLRYSVLFTVESLSLLYCWRHETGLSPPVKYFTDRSNTVILLWIIYRFFSVLCLLCLWVSVYLCLVVTCWERTDLLALVCGVWLWVCYFPFGILGQVWYLIVSIPDLFTLTYFNSEFGGSQTAADIGVNFHLLFSYVLFD